VIDAVIFDMDGLLVDTEWMWREVEIKVFASVDIKLTDQVCRRTTGLNVHQVVQYWYDRSPWDLSVKSKESVVDDIQKNMVKIIEKDVNPLPGVMDILNYFSKQEQIQTAVASASSMMLINAVAKTLELSKYFDIVHSAEFGTYSKPHPEVFLTTAKRLGVNPLKCLVFEDSIAGVVAAKAARMKCIAVPEQEMFHHKGYGIADQKIESLKSFHEKRIESIIKGM
jgi:mannitol-1-/sugar-/sorbitol-6-/2-deoxyglucose-6-phosphatase